MYLLDNAKHPYIPVAIPSVHPEASIAHAGKQLGNVDPRFSDYTDVYENRTLLRAAVPNVQDIYVMVPKGETDLVDIDTPDDRIAANDLHREIDVHGDALITTQRRTGLMLNAADCVPLVIAEPKKNILSLIHLGWRGAAYRLHEGVIDYAQEAYDLDIANAVAYLGPSIQPESYTAATLHETQQDDPVWEAHVHKYGNGYRIDLPGFIVKTLVQAGMSPDNITASTIDTGNPDTNHFSHTLHKRDGVKRGCNGFIVALG